MLYVRHHASLPARITSLLLSAMLLFAVVMLVAGHIHKKNAISSFEATSELVKQRLEQQVALLKLSAAIQDNNHSVRTPLHQLTEVRLTDNGCILWDKQSRYLDSPYYVFLEQPLCQQPPAGIGRMITGSQLLATLAQGSAIFQGIYFISPSGLYISGQRRQVEMGKSYHELAKRPYLQKAAANDSALTISKPYSDLVEVDSVITATLKIVRPDGLSGYLNSDIKVAELLRDNRFGLSISEAPAPYLLSREIIAFGNKSGLYLSLDTSVLANLKQFINQFSGETLAVLSLCLLLSSAVDARYRINTLARAASTDRLTGLANRTVLSQQPWQEYKHPLVAFALIDLDNFKRINDQYGHSFGDQALQRVAEVITDNIRSYDCAIRYGGDEILLLLSVKQAEHAQAVLERIRSQVADQPISYANQQCQLTLSIGCVCVAKASISGDATSEIEQADNQLYLAKHGGRNQVQSRYLVNWS